MDAQHQLLTINEVCERTRLSRSTIYNLIKKGSFPRQITEGRSSRWLLGEVFGWVDEKAKARCQSRDHLPGRLQK